MESPDDASPESMDKKSDETISALRRAAAALEAALREAARLGRRREPPADRRAS